MKEFLWALAIIFQIEGGWSEMDGGTNYGITAATLTMANRLQIVHTQNIRELTKTEAAKIYYMMYWQESGANKYPYPLNLVVFDASVHMGPGEAKRLLRISVQNSPSLRVRDISRQYIHERYKKLQTLKRFPKYRRSWERRMQTIARYANTARNTRF
jgi:lysozyme family protein